MKKEAIVQRELSFEPSQLQTEKLIEEVKEKIPPQIREIIQNNQLTWHELDNLKSWIQVQESNFVQQLSQGTKEKYKLLNKMKTIFGEKYFEYNRSHSKHTQTPINPQINLFDDPNFGFNSTQTPTRQHGSISGRLQRLATPSSQSKSPKRDGTFDRSMPKEYNIMLSRVMVGHDKRCGADCEHLRRAYALKRKFFGIIFPMKTLRFDREIFEE